MIAPVDDSFSSIERSDLPFFSPWRVSWVALVLLALYATIVLSAALPLRLADAAWQLGVYNAVVNASAFPLVGLALLHLSSDLQPGSKTLARRALVFSRLAVPIALGFLLLIPLQGYLLWQQSNTAASGQANLLASQQSTLASLRQAVQQAGSVAELQERLTAMQVPPFSPAEQALPLPQLKLQLNEALEQADQALQRRRAELPEADTLKFIPLALRNGFACLALAIGFAALGQRRRAPGPLLMEWHHFFHRLRLWRRSRVSSSSNHQLESYLEDIGPDKTSAR